MLFSTVILIISTTFGDKCTFIQGYQMNSSRLRECLDSIPMDGKMFNISEFKTNTLKMVNRYAFTNEVFEFAHELENEPFDLVGRVESALNSKFTLLYDYLMSVRRVFKELMDPHVDIYLPGVSCFQDVFPFEFVPSEPVYFEEDANGVPIFEDDDVVLKIGELIPVRCLSPYYSAESTLMIGGIVTKLELPDLEQVDEPPLKTLYRWTKQYCKSRRTSYGQFQSVLYRDFYIRDVFDHPHSSEPINVTYLDEDGSEHTIRVPFYQFVSMNISNTSQFLACSRTSSPTPSSRLIAHRSPSQSHSAPRLVSSTLSSHSTSSLPQHSLLTAFPHSYGYLFDPPHAPLNPIVKVMPPHEIYMNPLRQFFVHLLFQRGPFLDEVTTHGDVQLMAHSQYLTAFIHPLNRVLLLHFHSTGLLNGLDISDILDEVTNLLSEARKAKVDKCVISLLGNSGGSVFLTEILARLFWPTETSFLNFTVPLPSRNSLWRNITGLDSDPHIRFWDDSSFDYTTSSIPYRTRSSRRVLKNGTIITNTRLWSKPFQYILNATELRLLVPHQKFFRRTLFEKEDLIIVCDPSVMSAGSMFAYFAKAKNLATIVGLGGGLKGMNQSHYDIGQSASGPVVWMNLTREPFIIGQYTGGTTLSIEEDEDAELMEFKHIRPDYIIPFLPTSESLRSASFHSWLAEQLQDVFLEERKSQSIQTQNNQDL